MCYYITSAIPNQTNVQNLRNILQNHRLNIDIIDNPYIPKRLSDRYVYFRPTTGNCDCGTALGRSNRLKKESTNSEIVKLRKRGWSSTKIDRWVKEKESYRSKIEETKDYSRNPDLTEEKFWYSTLSDVFMSGSCEEFGLLLRWYDKDIKSNFELKNIQKIKFISITEVFFSKMQEDNLYLFTQ
ncbi:hypothetical protein [Leptospira alstonii]|uniref:Uncharacterized protein n=2 Tax=Leptospira alstonii TaxID=28452 RepID=M6D1B4_9LEPT|nr:hypothetical protein [Leptospira alstonii]EMJ97769.1 hypothetical protein LEP1GSC194_3929 [Leptospira alstonii serovar Sichuan str. 79601]EQA82077.1 hypothetical protein LEP1GSC193_3400 [Leptospira alstonii serovar Pingchang str. 80-412]